MTRIIIRAMREREPFIAYLTQELPHAEWCFDQKRNAMDTFLRALEMAGSQSAVHMEDDTILCDGFVQKLEAAIAQHPHHVVQFFSMRSADLTVGSRWDGDFMMGQCFYLPPGYSEQIRNYYEYWPNKEKHPTGLDTMVCDWLKFRRMKYWLHVPSLVDHRDCKSLINPRRSTKRQSKTFKK